MSESDLVAHIRKLANDPRRRTAISQKLIDLSVQPLGKPLPQPATRTAVQDAETRMGFPLPTLLEKLWTEVGNGGFGPGDGLFCVDNEPASELSMSIPNVYLQSIADDSYAWPKKLVMICEWGCGYFSAIDCSTAEGEVINLLDDLKRKPIGCTFAHWMEDWVNGVDLWTRDFSKLGPNPVGTSP